MLEDLLNDQTSSNSIVIVDNFEKDSHLILSLFIKKLTERQNITINIYPCDRHTLKYWTRFENKVRLNRTLLKSLFIERDKPIFESIRNELDQDVRNFLVFDNINLIIRHLQGNPFLLFQFITAIRQQRNISGILMVLHEDSIDKTVINQLSLLVQTMIRICDTTLKPSDLTQFGSLNKHLFKYHLSIDNRSYRNFKIKNFDETLYLTEDVEILKIEKHIIKSNEKKPVEEEKEDEMLKGLTFNVHLSSDDLEAKRNLVLPYEIVGKPKKNDQKETSTKEESKIFYAPDERDDVDDDDPDDDLNF